MNLAQTYCVDHRGHQHAHCTSQKADPAGPDSGSDANEIAIAQTSV
eukprot:SAG31_NODE_13923_length_837_cov_1.233062_1_plen_45_part_10